MFGKTTKAVVKDGRLTVMTNDARHPGVLSLALDQVQSGQFETASAENGGTALLFKSSGKKTGETLAVYDSANKAVAAMGAVYKALSGARKGGGGFWGGVLKTLVITVAILLVLAVLISAVLSWALSDAVEQAAGADTLPAVTEETASAGPSGNMAEPAPVLPVGEAFPALDYIQATQGDAAANNEGM